MPASAPSPRPPRRSPREVAVDIVRRLQQAGHVAYFAGGCVRDQLLGREPADFDVATSARPEQIAALFRRTRAVGQHFGVMLVLSDGLQLEVATFRTDGDYRDGRRPDQVTFTTAEHDAQRRDFTINGLFYDPLADRVIDYVGGQEDLRAGVLRAIGDPPRRFEEDHLRLLRAVRFAARFDLVIEPATWAAIQAMGGNLAGVSPERILEELEKIAGLGGVPAGAPSRQSRAVQLIADGGLLAAVLPEYEPFAAHLPLAVQLVARLPAPGPLAALLAAWLSTARPEPTRPLPAAQAVPLARLAARVVLRLRGSNALKSGLCWLAEHHGDLSRPLELADLRLLRAHAHWSDLAALAQARLACGCDEADVVDRQLVRAATYATADAAAPPPLVTGDRLLASGFEPGPALGRVLQAVYRAQLNGEIGTADAALAMAQALRTG